MKKRYRYIILAGIVSGFVFKDPCLGPFFGMIVAVVIGIPLFFFCSGLIKLFVKGNAARIDLTAVLVSIFLTIGIVGLLFQPPGWLRFRILLANPPPSSVKIIRSRWLKGAFDVPSYIKFEIDKADLCKIVIEKGYEKHEFDPYEEENFRKDKWLNIENLDKTEVYHLKSDSTSEYIIYDPNSKQAFHILFLIE